MRYRKGLVLGLFLVALTVAVVNCGGEGSSLSPSNNFTNTGPYLITGAVTSSGAGLQGVTMTLGGAGSATATTDASGNFTFPGLHSGSYTVSPSMTGYTFSPASSAQTVNSADITGVAFTATASTASTYSISGTVASSGISLQGVTMTLSGAGSATATTDASGNYTFAGLVNGSYTVTPSKTGYTFSPTSRAQSVGGANISGVNFGANVTSTPPSGTTGVFFPDYQPGVSSTCTWTYQWTLGSLSMPFSTSSGSQVTVNYLSGALSGRLIAMPGNISFLEYNDGTTFKILGFNDGATTTDVATDCNMTAPHPGYSYDTVYNGMIKDQTASYFQTAGTSSPCTGPDDTQKILFTVQDVTVNGVLYHNAILHWYLDLMKSFKNVNSPQFTTMGIISPTNAQTGGSSLTALDIYASGIGVVASAEIDALSGTLQNLAEMTSYVCH